MTDIRAPRLIQRHVADPQREQAEIVAGLLAPASQTSPKYLYDRLGSHLFEAITELPEYYPTRTEAAIFAQHGAEIARRIGTGATLVDLGAGNCVKATRLFPLLEPRRYVALDISVEFLHDALRRVQREHPQLEVIGLGLDFSARLDLSGDLIDGRGVFFYPGSSIGNFTPDEALGFLQRVRAQAAGGGLLIGIDLVKATPLLEAAYADALGVTGAFNRNLLLQLNRLIGSDFRPADWHHIGVYNEPASRIEMHLEARHALQVTWPSGQRSFAAGERIHTESSYKYTVHDFATLLARAGFASSKCWTDERGWFAVFWAQSEA